MIQRIQTVFLILVIVIGYGHLWQDPVYASLTSNYNGSSNVLMFWHNYSEVETDIDKAYVSDLPTAFFTVLMIVCALGTLFLFQNRKLQLKGAWLTLWFSILAVATLYLKYFLWLWSHEKYTVHFEIHFIWPHFLILYAALSVYKIRKDERIVRSMDRIR